MYAVIKATLVQSANDETAKACGLYEAHGHRIVVGHGDEDGGLYTPIELHHRDIVMCCFPAAVQKQYPTLHVVGDWDSCSVVQYRNGHLAVGCPDGDDVRDILDANYELFLTLDKKAE
jgi:hypothetical protein